MRRIVPVLFTVSLVALAILAMGCNKQVPQTDLDRFIAEFSELDQETQAAQLRETAAGEKPRSTYANYMIGNNFYLDAGQAAIDEGWNSGAVNALLDSSEIYFNKAVAQDSTFIEALVNLGSLWDDRSQQMGNRQEREYRTSEAERHYHLALDVSPYDEKARCNLGALYLRQRRTGDALAEFQKVLDHDPQSSLAHYNLAIMFAERKIYREAIVEWELAVKYDPDGDIGARSRDNIEIVKELMKTPEPDSVK